MPEIFSEDSRKILKKAKYEMQQLKHPFIGSEHLILSILSFKDLDITIKLKEYHLTYDNFKQELLNVIGIGTSFNSYFIYTPLLKRIIENAIINSKEDNLGEVNPNSLFFSILEEGEGIGIRILNNLDIDIDELYKDLELKEFISKKSKNRKKLLVNEISYDLVEKAKNNKIDPIFDRDMETNRLIEILLRKNKNNPLLIGEAGVGKTAIVENLAMKIASGMVPLELKNKKIIAISMASLVAGTKYRGEFEEKVERIIKEIEESQDLIIFIDEMHSIVGAGGAEGAIDAANILKPALARGKFKLIGATTTREYKETIAKDKALNRRFQTILINEPSINETKNILKKLKPIYEKYHSVSIPNDLIDKIVELSDKYIFERKNPDKSIDILDEVCTKRSLVKTKNNLKIELLNKELNQISKMKNNYIINQDFKNAFKLKEEELKKEDKLNELLISNSTDKKIVTLKDISSIIKAKSNVPVFEIDKEDIKKIKGLEKKLKSKIIGQDDVIKTLVHETLKIKLGYKETNLPISFLFTGKSGVGKTSLVKEYAKELNMNLIRIDGSEYNESHSISKIIGSPPGYVGYESKSVLDDVKNNPYSIILVDEIDKACSSFLNLFLQILDEGFITNSSLEKIYFNHSMIIMTSNKCSNINNIGFNDNKNLVIKEDLNEYFTSEFLNRINYCLTFSDLKLNDIKKIVEREIKKVILKFKYHNINLVVDNKVVKDIITLSNYNEFGARKIKKIIEEKIDNIVIDDILLGKNDITVQTIH